MKEERGWIQGGDSTFQTTQMMVTDLYRLICYLLLSAIFVYVFFFSKYRCFLYLFLCFICRVIILTASCFNHPRISHESVGLWSSWYIVSWTAVGFNAEKLHTFYRDQKNQKKYCSQPGVCSKKSKKSWNIRVLMTKHFPDGLWVQGMTGIHKKGAKSPTKPLANF